jgi:hypothetical protein
MKNDSKPSCLMVEKLDLPNGMELRRKQPPPRGKREPFVLISESSVLVPHDQWDEATSRIR